MEYRLIQTDGDIYVCGADERPANRTSWSEAAVATFADAVRSNFAGAWIPQVDRQAEGAYLYFIPAPVPKRGRPAKGTRRNVLWMTEAEAAAVQETLARLRGQQQTQ